MGVATMTNKMTLFVTLVGRAEQFEAHLSELFTDFNLFSLFALEGSGSRD